MICEQSAFTNQCKRFLKFVHTPTFYKFYVSLVQAHTVFKLFQVEV